jgi:hypothetical protein
MSMQDKIGEQWLRNEGKGYVSSNIGFSSRKLKQQSGN